MVLGPFPWCPLPPRGDAQPKNLPWDQEARRPLLGAMAMYLAWGREVALVSWSLARATSLLQVMLLVWWFLARATSLLQLMLRLTRRYRALNQLGALIQAR